jgi:hypothetical protein
LSSPIEPKKKGNIQYQLVGTVKLRFYFFLAGLQGKPAGVLSISGLNCAWSVAVFSVAIFPLDAVDYIAEKGYGQLLWQKGNNN